MAHLTLQRAAESLIDIGQTQVAAQAGVDAASRSARLTSRVTAS
jgi:hypothetical protein